MSAAGIAPSRVDAAAGHGSPVVVCTQLNKVFKDFWMRDHARAVTNLSLEIQPREVFGLLGPNGSGKSTTIKMILGLLKPTSGRVAVFGKSPDDVEMKRRIGYLPEESYLYAFLNARETLDYYAKLFELDYKTRQRRIDELLDMLGLANAQHRPVREYSKGMQRRIGIAQALINDPEFLILDEPTTGLDPLGTRQIKDLIIELGRRGKTILLSSHLLADVEDCVDRLVILYGGQIRAQGTCAELLESRDRTTIETDTLDDATVSEIDRLVRSRTGGDKSVRRVSRPRQSLESLFIDIVERARAEQVSTSGATSGGETASFLKGSELIENLVKASDEPVKAVAAAPVEKPGESVIDALVSGKQTMEAQAKQAAPSRPAPVAPVKQEGVDASVIDSLLGGGGESGSEGTDGGNKR
ncbi:MAG TPA: ABC transporter ATP-binding protein [Phycisphaerales bacterium]|nr:ABC transporter ATP-binding protein [Phycisphaerales bacterium]